MRVADRTKQLEAANDELEAFSYSVSHDLRAPLRGIDGYARILYEDCGGQLDAEGIRLIGVVRSEAKRMGHLIDDLLAFSRMGRKHLEKSQVDMRTLAQDAYQSVTDSLPEAAIQFTLGALPLAMGDRSLLRQVFVNLIGNAVKFSRNQQPPVIEVGFGVDSGKTVYFVKDNGVGFDERYRHKLFGVFQRLHGEAEFEGTGIGLALVQRIVLRHGGRVWAMSKPNSGATFYFTIPNILSEKSSE
jgi:light-regulated signal transduction histidine kinase (bacteriophytochrome)